EGRSTTDQPDEANEHPGRASSGQRSRNAKALSHIVQAEANNEDCRELYGATGRRLTNRQTFREVVQPNADGNHQGYGLRCNESYFTLLVFHPGLLFWPPDKPPLKID